jgi:GAF domain
MNNRRETMPALAEKDCSEDPSKDVSEVLVAAECHATLERLLTALRWLIPADGASLYVRRGGTLRLTLAQNDTLSARLGEAEFRRRLLGQVVAVNSRSIVGHVALTGEAVNILDVESIPPDSPYTFRPVIHRTVYCYRSLLTAPIFHETGTIVGVVQLVNALDDGVRPVPFGPAAKALVRQFCVKAARVIGRQTPSQAFSPAVRTQRIGGGRVSLADQRLSLANLKRVKALGLTIPPALLLWADQVIEGRFTEVEYLQITGPREDT